MKLLKGALIAWKLILIDMEDIKSQKIPIGQRRLILHIAKSLGNQGAGASVQDVPVVQPQQSTPSVNQSQQPVEINLAAGQQPADLYQRTLLDSLISQQEQLSSGQPVREQSQTQPTWRDPQIHIATATGKSASPFYDICDFVPNSVEEELVIGGQGDQQVVVKSGPKKPKLENLSLSQWSIANMAILYKLVGEGKLPGSALMDCLSYSTKIYQLVQKCSLPSVLLYDREYRQLQASMEFRWGTDVQHLHTLHLQPRDKLLKQGTHYQNGKKGPVQTHSAKQKLEKRDVGICHNYNTQKGCTYPQCKYQHQCLVPGCNQKHSVTSHVEKN